MFCPNCGKENAEDSRYCLYCGYQFVQQENNDIYSHSYYKKSYTRGRNDKKQTSAFSFAGVFFTGVVSMLFIALFVFGYFFAKNYFSGDLLNLDKMKYQQYVENPSLIPELVQPDNMNGFITNLHEVQTFLELYLKVSDDDMDTKLETFDKYRKELLKMQHIDNSNILDVNVKYQFPRTQREFNVVKKQYEKVLSKVGLTIVADDTYTKYHLVEDTRFTYKKYGKYMPDDIREYLKLRAKHYKQCMFKNELSVKPYELASRIADYEAFYNSHKEFRYSDEVKDLMFSYSLIYAFTSDRENVASQKALKKSDKKFVKNYPMSEFKELFSHLSTSANGISEKQFDDMYPYDYQKNLSAIKPEQSELGDVFTIVRRNIMKLKSLDNFEYMFVSSTGAWTKYDAEKPLKNGDVILAKTEDGYEVYDHKYKKTNQTIQLEENAKFFIKDNQLLVYSPKHLQIQVLENSYGTFTFRPLSVKAIKKLYPSILLINIDTFGELSVQIDKQSGAQTYMLISTSGGNYEGYRLSGDMTLGELSNIFTVSGDSAQVIWSPNTDGDSYHMYFINQKASDQQAKEVNVE